MPEVFFEQSGEGDVPGVGEPQPGRGLSIVASERVDSVLLWPQVYHLSGSHGERVSEHGCQIGSNNGVEYSYWQFWHISDSHRP